MSKTRLTTTSRRTFAWWMRPLISASVVLPFLLVLSSTRTSWPSSAPICSSTASHWTLWEDRCLQAPRARSRRASALAGARPVGEEAQLLYAALAQAVLAHHAARSASTFVPRFSLARFRLATLQRSSPPWSIGASPAGSSGTTATRRQGRRSASRARALPSFLPRSQAFSFASPRRPGVQVQRFGQGGAAGGGGAHSRDEGPGRQAGGASA